MEKDIESLLQKSERLSQRFIHLCRERWFSKNYEEYIFHIFENNPSYINALMTKNERNFPLLALASRKKVVKEKLDKIIHPNSSISS